jgi:transposase
MLTWPRSVRVFLCTEPTDMRRSFDSLAEMTRRVLREQPTSGHLFVFTSRRADRVKILYWDRGGYALWYKRLETGQFHLPAAEGGRVELDAPELSLLLEGIDLSGAKRQRRFVPGTGADR